MRQHLWTTAACAILVLAVPGFAQEPERAKPMDEERHTQMQAMHEEMMARHQTMMAEMEAAHARLDSLVAAMKAAEGDDAKIAAMTALLEELVAQHGGMCARMMEGMEGMPSGERPPQHQHP